MADKPTLMDFTSSILHPSVIAAFIAGVVTVFTSLLAFPSVVRVFLPNEVELQRLELDKKKFESQSALPRSKFALDDPDLNVVRERLIALAADTDRGRSERMARAMARLSLIPPEWSDIQIKTGKLEKDEIAFLKYRWLRRDKAPATGFVSPSNYRLCLAGNGYFEFPDKSPVKKALEIQCSQPIKAD